MSVAQMAVRMPESWRSLEGQVVNREFPLKKFVGESGHSGVFLTEFRQQKAAIKLIEADKELADQQLTYWKRAAALNHPNLLKILASGRCVLNGGPLLYVVMEYADENLGEILPARALTIDETKVLLPRVLAALEYLHGQGFAHGSVRPANVLATGDQLRMATDSVTPLGDTKLGRGRRTAYDTPEGGPAMPAADVWAVGVMLVEVLTQAKPVWREDANGDMILGQEVPQPFLEIARNCLRRDPGRRWTLAEIALQLRGPARERKEASRPSAVPPARKSWAWVAVAAALALAIGIGVVAGRRNPEPAPVATEAKPVQSAPIESAPPAKPVVSKPSAGKSAVKKGPSENTPTPAAAKSPVTAPETRPTVASVPLPEVTQQVQPEVSQNALNTITGKVRVRVRVTCDAAGNVSDANFETEGPSKYFARKAMEAAQKWKFAGAGERVITFYFMRSGTEANMEAAR